MSPEAELAHLRSAFRRLAFEAGLEPNSEPMWHADEACRWVFLPGDLGVAARRAIELGDDPVSLA